MWAIRPRPVERAATPGVKVRVRVRVRVRAGVN